MTDEYTRLIAAAADAQEARESETYRALNTELGQIDTDLLALQLRRADVVSTLDSYDARISDTKADLDRYFAEQRGETGMVSAQPFVKVGAGQYANPYVLDRRVITETEDMGALRASLDDDEDEASTARAHGANGLI
jgi:hypothetical protein